jgi:hypothetical protein
MLKAIHTPVAPGSAWGLAVNVGSRLTLKSLLPDTIDTIRVSGFHPELGTATVTVCSPIDRFTDSGVVLPVSIPSTLTVHQKDKKSPSSYRYPIDLKQQQQKSKEIERQSRSCFTVSLCVRK